MFAGVEGIISVGVFSFMSGIAISTLEKKGRKSEAATVALITRIMFWLMLLPQLWFGITGMMNNFGIRYFINF